MVCFTAIPAGQADEEKESCTHRPHALGQLEERVEESTQVGGILAHEEFATEHREVTLSERQKETSVIIAALGSRG